MDCLFCKIANKEISSNIIYEDDDYLAFLDINQSTLGHTLIIPKKHYDDVTMVNEKILNELFQVAKRISDIFQEKMNIKGFTYMINYLDAQEVKHLHLHLLPSNSSNITLTPEELITKLKDE